MDSLKRVYNKNKSSSDVKRTIRELKNKVYNYSEMEQMVREATCNDATEPQVTLMREVAKGTFTVEFTSIMGIIWKRIREEKNERHPFKCLILLEFLLREGNAEMVLAQIQSNLHLISALTNFRLINDQHIDVGMQVRERADRFLRFLRDEPTAEERDMGKRAPPPGFSAGPPSEETWKSQVRWDAADGPPAPQYGAPRQTGGKFSVVIKPKEGSAAPIPRLGEPANPSCGSRPAASGPSDMDLLGDMSAPAPPPPPDLFGAAPIDPFAVGGGRDPFASNGGSDPFAFNGGSDPFASNGAAADPFGAPAASDPFASPPSAPDPFGSSAPFGTPAPAPFGGGALSLLDGPGGQDELLSLALPTDVMSGAMYGVAPGANDMQLLGGIDLASPSSNQAINSLFSNDDAFGSGPAPPSAPPPPPDEWASIKQSNIINLDNLNISGKQQASPKPSSAAPKQSLAQMAGRPQDGQTGGAPLGGGTPMGGGMGGMPMSGGGPQLGGMGGARPMGSMGGPPMGGMGGQPMGGMGGQPMGGMGGQPMGGMGGQPMGGMGGQPMGGMGGQPMGGMSGVPMGMSMGGQPMGMSGVPMGMPQQGYGMQPNPFAQQQRSHAMPPMQPRKV